MKIEQLLIAFAISLLTFFGILVSETVRFNFVNSIENPFEKAVDLNEIKKTEKERFEIFTKDGEFFQLYPNSEINFENKKREIVNGEVFISSQFISEKNLEEAEILETFNEKTTPKVGQYRVGPILIKAPASTFFIYRDKEKKESKVYAYDHSIAIFFPESNLPFILPPGMFIEIKEDLISEKTGRLYYTKLKKELRLMEFMMSFSINEKSEKIEDKIKISLEKFRKLKQKIEIYAKKLPNSWISSRPSSLIGRVSKIIKNIQKDYAINYPEKKRQRIVFENLVRNFINANYEVEKGKKTLAENYIKKFLKIFKQKEWEILMVSNLEIKKNWDDFERAQKAWLRSIFSDEIANVFSIIWVNKKQQDDIENLEETFVSIETFIANDDIKKAELEFKKMIPLVEKLKIPESESKKRKITQTRRLLTELFKRQSSFQKKEIFDLYILLVEKETRAYIKQKIGEELTLEIAQDILYFLKKFLDPKSVNSQNAKILVKIYNYLEIDKIAEGLGRQIFSEEELETVELVAYVGSSGLTKEEIESLRKVKQEEKEMKNRIKELEEEYEKEETQKFSQKIKDKDSLYFFLKTNGIEVSKMEIKELLEGELFRFQNAFFSSEKVSGTYQVSQQIFKIITIGGEVQRKLNLRFFDSFLLNIKNTLEESKKETKKEETTFIPQNSGRTAMERRILKKLLEKEGFEVSIKDILALDKDAITFEVKNLMYDKKYRLKFVYSQLTKRVKEVVLENGKNTFEFIEEFEIKNLAKSIEEKVAKMFNEKMDEK